MRISVDTLCIALTVLLYSVELSSQTSIWELFPEYKNNILPPAKKYECGKIKQSPYLRGEVKGHIIEFDEKSTLYVRDHVIIGWKYIDIIAPLFDTSGRTSIVFNMKNNSFVSLDTADLRTLGVTRRVRHVLADDRAYIDRANQQAKIQEIHHTHGQTSHMVNHAVNHQGNHQVINPAEPQAIPYTHDPTSHMVNHALNDQENYEAINPVEFQAIYDAHHQAGYGVNHDGSNQGNNHALNQAEFQAIPYAHDQTSYRVNHAANDPENYQASNQVDYQAKFLAHYEANHGIIHQVNNSGAQARPQMNLQANTQAYEMYRDYFRRQKGN